MWSYGLKTTLVRVPLSPDLASIESRKPNRTVTQKPLDWWQCVTLTLIHEGTKFLYKLGESLLPNDRLMVLSRESREELGGNPVYLSDTSFSLATHFLCFRYLDPTYGMDVENAIIAHFVVPGRSGAI